MGSRCQKPILLRNKSIGGNNTVPCGRCENCRKRRISNWSHRLMQEDKVSSSSYFLTLTYDSDNVPITKNGFMDIRKNDLQLFFKRLRKAHGINGGRSLKYYAVGEYGGRFKRPHYHVLLFNADLSILIGKKYATAVSYGSIELDGKRGFMCEAWSPRDKPIGHITIGKVSEASVGYTMKYMSKPSVIPMHRNDDRTPEFSLMSKGLGASYLTDAMIKWYNADLENRQYCVLEDNKKISLPRYYKLRLMSQDERDTLALFELEYRQDRNNFQEQKKESSARARSEAYYAGLTRLKYNESENQKF